MGKDIISPKTLKMSADMLMQVGRVVFVNYGPCAGRLAVVVDIVDENRILIDGPTTGVDRQVMPAKRIQLTKFRINAVMRNQHRANLTKNTKAFDLEKRWNETGFPKRLNAQRLRAQNSDFNRFKAMVLRRQVAKHVRSWAKKNRSSK